MLRFIVLMFLLCLFSIIFGEGVFYGRIPNAVMLRKLLIGGFVFVTFLFCGITYLKVAEFIDLKSELRVAIFIITLCGIASLSMYVLNDVELKICVGTSAGFSLLTICCIMKNKII